MDRIFFFGGLCTLTVGTWLTNATMGTKLVLSGIILIIFVQDQDLRSRTNEEPERRTSFVHRLSENLYDQSKQMTQLTDSLQSAQDTLDWLRLSNPGRLVKEVDTNQVELSL